MKLLLFMLLISTTACRQVYPLDIGGGFKIDYDSRSVLTLMNSGNTILSDCFIDGYYQDSNIVLVRCRDKTPLTGNSRFHLHIAGEHLYEQARDSVLIFEKLRKMGKENIQITPLP